MPSHFPSVLEEAKRQTEAELKIVRGTVMKYVILATIVALITTPLFVVNWSKLGFPFNVLPWGIPVFVFFGAWHAWSKHFCGHYEGLLKSLEIEPETAEDYSIRAYALAEQDFIDAAREDYRKALEMEPENDDILFEYACLLWYRMKSEDALPIAEKLSQIDGINQAEAFVIKGQVVAASDPATAKTCFDKAIELDPEDDDYHLARVRFYLDADRPNDAGKAMETVTKLLKRTRIPASAEYYELQGVLAMKQGDPTGAVKWLSKAIALDKTSAEYYRLRSEAYEALGEMSRANADRANQDLWFRLVSLADARTPDTK